MGRRIVRRAMDGIAGSTDWTTIGARIRRAAELAGALHMLERARIARPACRALGGSDSAGREEPAGD